MADTDASDESLSSQSSSSRYFSAILLALLLLTVVYRSVGITRPLVGNFSTKSVIYGMIARNWAEDRAGLFYPTMDVLVGGERSLHMLEFSVSTQLTGALWKWFGGSLDIWGRATSIAFLAASVLLLVAMVRRRHGDAAACGAGAMLALSPISVIYGQTFMLDSSIVFFTRRGVLLCRSLATVGSEALVAALDAVLCPPAPDEGLSRAAAVAHGGHGALAGAVWADRSGAAAVAARPVLGRLGAGHPGRDSGYALVPSCNSDGRAGESPTQSTSIPVSRVTRQAIALPIRCCSRAISTVRPSTI